MAEESSEQQLYPDVTICNLYPTYDIEAISERISWQNYSRVFDEADRSITFRELCRAASLSTSEIVSVGKYLYSCTKYFSNFPIFDENVTSDNQLIKSHKLHDWQWRESKSNTCEPVIKIHWDPNYYASPSLDVYFQVHTAIARLKSILSLIQILLRRNFSIYTRCLH